MSSSTENLNNKNILEAVNKRRNFAIISHPDAGKTTLTEKLLLYGGAIQQAGAVKARGNQRKATSDWMELEKQRGISITSTVFSQNPIIVSSSFTIILSSIDCPISLHSFCTTRLVSSTIFTLFC